MDELGEVRAVKPPVWQSGAILAVMAAICTSLVALTYRSTEARIDANNRALLQQSLAPALSGRNFDNNLIGSRISIPPPHELPGTDIAEVYRATLGGEPVAALFVVSAPGGFVGPIRLLIGVDAAGTVTGVRVLQHRETPGIGDLIDSTRSDWILQFDGTSIDAPPQERWAIKVDGGDFDQLTGASVTPRAVVNGILETLLYFGANRDKIFVTQSDAGAGE